MIHIHRYTKEDFDLISEEDGIYKFCGTKVCKKCGKVKKRILMIEQEKRYKK